MQRYFLYYIRKDGLAFLIEFISIRFVLKDGLCVFVSTSFYFEFLLVPVIIPNKSIFFKTFYSYALCALMGFTFKSIHFCKLWLAFLIIEDLHQTA